MKKEFKNACTDRFPMEIDYKGIKFHREQTDEKRNYYDYFSSCDFDELMDFINNSEYDIMPKYKNLSNLWGDFTGDGYGTVLLVKPINLNNSNWREEIKSII